MAKAPKPFPLVLISVLIQYPVIVHFTDPHGLSHDTEYWHNYVKQGIRISLISSCDYWRDVNIMIMTTSKATLSYYGVEALVVWQSQSRRAMCVLQSDRDTHQRAAHWLIVRLVSHTKDRQDLTIRREWLSWELSKKRRAGLKDDQADVLRD